MTRDEAVRRGVWNDHLKADFEGPDDPNYAIVIVRPYRIEYWGMGSMEPEVWEG